MPTPRSQPPRNSQRRNSLQDDTPVRTRAGRAGKPAPSKPEQADFAHERSSPTKLSPAATRKTTRSASNISGRSFEAASDIFASYERPLFMVFGLSPEFMAGLRKHHGKLPKERKSLASSIPQPDETLGEDDDDSESEEESVDASDDEEQLVSHATSRGRGRGGRGARGGRGRGGRGRGRGRGGRPRGGLARAASPSHPRSYRNAALMHPLTEVQDDDSANQSSQNSCARPDSASQDQSMGEAVDSDDDDENADDNENAVADDETEADGEDGPDVRKLSATPESSPPSGLHDSILSGTYMPPKPDPRAPPVKTPKNNPILKVSFPSQSASQTPRASTPAESAVPKLLRPEDDVLSDSDLPEPWIEGLPPPTEAECEDRADYLLQLRFKPMVDVQGVIASLTKYPVSQRSTESLYALAENTQNILKQWQDQYLMLDARTAPHMHPAKKACNGGRIPAAPDVFEVMKEADLYGYNYDPKKNPEAQDPWGQRPGAEKSGGRELRTRRTRDMLDSAPVSEEEEEEDGEGRPAKRQRRATRKFDGSDAGTGASTPKKHNGWGGARKKGVSRFSKNASETPEPESRAPKRARPTASNILHQRIQAMREASLISTGSGDEDSSAIEVDEHSDSNVKRGRPAGSKNAARRSDFGVKKGPRKKTSEVSTPVPSAHGPNAPPPALQSMSEGQGQFSLDPQPLSDPALHVPGSAEGVFQATPHLSAAHEATVSHSEMTDTYLNTTPLGHYNVNYVDETSSASGSRRKPRVKSEKRSQSMTTWWAERKARKKEQGDKTSTPLKLESRPGSSHDRRGGRASTGSAPVPASSAVPTEPPRRASLHYPDHPHHYPPPEEAYPTHHGPPPLTAPSPMYLYSSAPPPHSILQYSPLAALPTGTYPLSNPPPPTSQYGTRALAPAPLPPPPPQSYPTPYGPQSPSSSRPKSSGQLLRNAPPALAPAPPAHFSPYAPLSLGKDREHSFQVMVPGAQAQGQARRGSG